MYYDWVTNLLRLDIMTYDHAFDIHKRLRELSKSKNAPPEINEMLSLCENFQKNRIVKMEELIHKLGENTEELKCKNQELKSTIALSNEHIHYLTRELMSEGIDDK